MLRWHPEAEQELLDALAFYRQRANDALALQPLTEVDAAVDRVIARPGLQTPLAASLGGYPLHRFPYALVLSREADGRLLLALAHQRRQPGYWQARAPQLGAQDLGDTA